MKKATKKELLDTLDKAFPVVEGQVAVTGEVPMKKKVAQIKLVSYSMKMVIPTGQYANIQPEVVVKADDLEAAHNYLAGHFNRLWKEYYMIEERRKEINVTRKTSSEVQLPVAAPYTQEDIAKSTTPPSPLASVASEKAIRAIDACMNLDALELIENQIKKSEKVPEDEKPSVLAILEEKRASLNARNEQ